MSALESEYDLITLIGPGGVGKSHQARVIHRLRTGRARTSHWISLEGTHRAVDICVAVASTLRIPARGGIGDNLLLSRIEAALKAADDHLFIFDAAEDAIAELSALLERWRKLGGNVRYLVTSRVPLGVADEKAQVIQVERLITDAPEDTLSPALTLLLERAEEAGRSFDATGPHRASLDALARLMGGHPRALELMGGQLARLEPDWLLAEVRKYMVDPAGVDPSRFPAELVAATACTLSLLSEDERSVLAQCGLFQGDFDPILAGDAFTIPEGVDVDDVIDGLWEQHLLKRRERAGQERFSLDRNLKASARTLLEKTEDEAQLWRRIAQTLIEKAETAAANYESTGDPVHLHFLVVEQENLLAILEHSLKFAESEEQGEDALRMVAALNPLFSLTLPLGQHEEYLDRAILQVRSASTDPELIGRVHRQRGVLRRLMGNLGGAAANFAEALEVARGREHARTLVDLGILHHQRQAFAEARRAYKEAFVLSQGVDRHNAARALGNLGALAHDVGAMDRAGHHYEHAISIFEKCGDARMTGIFYSHLATLRHEQGKWYESRGHFLSALKWLEPIGDRRLIGMVESALGVLDHEEGALVQARMRQLKAIALLNTAGDLRTAALAHLRLGMVMALLGKVDKAESHRQRGHLHLTGLGDPVAESLGHVVSGFVELGRALEHLNIGERGLAEPHYRAARDVTQTLRLQVPSPLEWSAEVRTANRLLHQALLPHRKSHPLADDVIVLQKDGSHFSSPAEGDQTLEHRPALAGILRLLIKARMEHPGESVNAEALAGAGFSDPKLRGTERENKVVAAVAALRGLGFGSVLIETEAGFLLDPLVDLDVR
jgi:tetratricopeptide (TPR) repeat protein